ncbi:MAG: hypothetical protein K5871_07705 [Lachnospiraceae bacterium]|nr:hypothetical protein [Lachnospiraceae bacterium]
MAFDQIEEDARIEGRIEGLRVGREEGREEGRAEGYNTAKNEFQEAIDKRDREIAFLKSLLEKNKSVN